MWPRGAPAPAHGEKYGACSLPAGGASSRSAVARLLPAGAVPPRLRPRGVLRFVHKPPRVSAGRGRGGPAAVGRAAPRTLSLLLRPAPRPRPRPRPRPAAPPRCCLRAGGPSPPCSVAAAGTRSRAVLAFVRGRGGPVARPLAAGGPPARVAAAAARGAVGRFLRPPPSARARVGPVRGRLGSGVFPFWFGVLGSAAAVGAAAVGRVRRLKGGLGFSALGHQNPWSNLVSIGGAKSREAAQSQVCRGGHRTPRATERSGKYCLRAPRLWLWARIGFVGSS